MTLLPGQSNIIINSEVVHAVIDWACDAFENYDTEADDISNEMESWTDARIERWVNRNYEGGMSQFIADGTY